MSSGADPVVRVGKSFGTGAKHGILLPKLDSTLPDNFADIFGWGDIESRDFSLLFFDWRDGLRGKDIVFDRV